jgi:phage tail-like protein
MLKRKKLTFFVAVVFMGLMCSGKAEEYRYVLEWNGYKVIFTTVSGLDQLTQQTVYQRSSVTNPLQNVRTVSAKSFSLKGGSCRIDNGLYKWFCTCNLTTKEKRDIMVRLLNSSGVILKTWKVVNASPVKVDAPTLNAKGGADVAIETVVLAYEGIELE